MSHDPKGSRFPLGAAGETTTPRRPQKRPPARFGRPGPPTWDCSELIRWLSALLESSRVARSGHLREILKSRSRSSGSVTSFARRALSRAYSRHFVSVRMLGCSEVDGWQPLLKGWSSWVPHAPRREGPTHGTGNRPAMMAAPARPFDPDRGIGTIAMPADDQSRRLTGRPRRVCASRRARRGGCAGRCHPAPSINPPLNPPAPRTTPPARLVDEVESVEDSIPPGTLTAGLSILPR